MPCGTHPIDIVKVPGQKKMYRVCFSFFFCSYKVLIYFCWFVCQVITREPPLTDLPHSGNLREFSWFGFEILSWVGKLETRKITKIIIYDKGRVNGGTNYDSPGPHWVPKLVYNKPVKAVVVVVAVTLMVDVDARRKNRRASRAEGFAIASPLSSSLNK